MALSLRAVRISDHATSEYAVKLRKAAVPACVIVIVLVLLQGGFTSASTCAVGLMAGICYLGKLAIGRFRASRGIGSSDTAKIEPKGLFSRLICSNGVPAKSSACAGESLAPVAILLFVGAFYAISALAHGGSTTMVLETSRWFSLVGMAACCGFPSACEKRAALDGLAITGACLAAAAAVVYLLAACGVPGMGGMVDSGRLMFTLGYANTAGLFFSVIAILCFASSKPRLRAAGVLPVTALAMTKSAGALVVFIAALCVLALRRKTRFYWILSVLGLLGVVAFALAFSDRIAEASQTFIERIVQIIDAGALLTAHPLLGIGPDMWQFAYPSIQTAQYRAAVVHSSYAQVSLDAGIVAGLALLAFVIASVIRRAKEGDFTSALCAGMIGIHSLFDFDLRFASVCLLLMLLLAPSGERSLQGDAPALEDNASVRGSYASAPRGNTSAPKQQGHQSVMRAFAVGLSLVMSLVGLGLALQAQAVERLSVQGDLAELERVIAITPGTETDPVMQLYHAGAFYHTGEYEACVQLADPGPGALENAVLYRCASYLALGDAQNASGTLVQALHAQPYNLRLFEMSRDLIVQLDAEGQLGDSFNEEAAYASEMLGRGHAPWLANQREVKPIP